MDNSIDCWTRGTVDCGCHGLHAGLKNLADTCVRRQDLATKCAVGQLHEVARSFVTKKKKKNVLVLREIFTYVNKGRSSLLTFNSGKRAITCPISDTLYIIMDPL